jgi:hypothetical protein
MHITVVRSELWAIYVSERARNIGNEHRQSDMHKVLLSDGVQLVGSGNSCTRAELTLDDFCTICAFVQHAGACTAAPSKYEPAHTWEAALLRWCTAEVHRQSVNHSNGETGRMIERLHESAVLHGFETDKHGVHSDRAV